MTDPDPHGRPILEVRDLQKRFQGNRVLRGLTVDIPRAEATALIGSNGAGKSTFLNIVSGLVRADSGHITLDGRDLTSASSHVRARAGLARTFQHPRSFRSLTALQAVLLARTPPQEEGIGRNLLKTLSIARGEDAQALTAARECLAICRLESVADTPAAELAYGEQKLLMLAQALAFDGDLFCLDELCAGLEPAVVKHLSGVFVALLKKGKTVLFIEHNLELVRELADHVVFLHEGVVYRSGEAVSVLRDPDVINLYLGD